MDSRQVHSNCSSLVKVDCKSCALVSKVITMKLASICELYRLSSQVVTHKGFNGSHVSRRVNSVMSLSPFLG